MSGKAGHESTMDRVEGVLSGDEAPRAAAMAMKASHAESGEGTSTSIIDALWLADIKITVMQEAQRGTDEKEKQNQKDGVGKETTQRDGREGEKEDLDGLEKRDDQEDNVANKDVRGGKKEKADIYKSNATAVARQKEAKAKAPRLARFVAELVKCGVLTKDTCLKQLSPALLEGSGLLGDARSLSKMVLRANTRKLYVQQKFNLLHEDAEGYSKLFTELYNAPHSSNAYSKTAQHKQGDALANRVTSLIGHFNIDPNRVEDMLLEVLEANIENFDTYLPLMRLFRRDRLCHILGRKFHAHQLDDETSTPSEDNEEDEDTMAVGGERGKSENNATEGASLGSNTSGDKEVNLDTSKTAVDPAPDSLYAVAALLIAAGNLDPKDLLPHLAPSNETLRRERQAREVSMMERSKRSGKVKIGLTPEERMKEAKELKEKLESEECSFRRSSIFNQKFGILSGLMSIGAWDTAVEYSSILKEMGANPGADPRVAKSACLFCKKLLSRMYEQLPVELNPIKLGLQQSSNHLRAKNIEAISSGSFIMPIPQDIAKMPSTVGPVLRFIGEHICLDLDLFAKVCRVLRHILVSHPEVAANNDEKTWIHGIISRVLLPGLALVDPGNPGIANELWAVLRCMPYGERYKAYSILKSDLYAIRNPLILKRALVIASTKSKLRRLAVETVKQQGRQIGRLSHSNPVVVFSTLLDQVEVYGNIIGVAVDALKYTTSLSNDVIVFLLIEKLASSREKLQGGDGVLSVWLNALASFAGTFFRRYPDTDVTGLLQFLINGLASRKSLDMVVLRNLVSSMAGIQVIAEISDDQLEGRSGGLVLRAQTNVLSRLGGSKRKAASALHSAMTAKVAGANTNGGEHEVKFGVVLVLLLAHQRGSIIIDSSISKQIKLTGRLYDECHMTLLQLVQFLSVKMSSPSLKIVSEARSAYLSVLPSMKDLLAVHSLSPGLAFHISRSRFSAFIRNNNNKNITSEKPHEGSEAQLSSESSPHSNMSKISCSPLEEGTLSSVQACMPEDTWLSISPSLYSIFWALSLYDIYTPNEKYESTKATLQNSVRSIDSTLRTTDSTTKAARDLRREQRSKRNANEDLVHEQKVQTANMEAVISWIKRHADKLLAGCKQLDKTPQCFLQNCILPRTLISPEDAYYCAKFAATMNDIEVPYWSSLNYYDKMHRCLPALVYCITEREAANLGVFFKETLRLLSKWNNAETYASCCATKPGFSISIKSESNIKATYEQYSKIFKKWHNKVRFVSGTFVIDAPNLATNICFLPILDGM